MSKNKEKPKSGSKKAQAGLGGISGTAMTLMITGLILVFSIIILSKFGQMETLRGVPVNASDLSKGYTNTGSVEYGAYNDTLDTVTGFSEWLPIVGLLAIAGIIIYLIVNSLPRAQ
jgi:hypothetical protein